MCTGQDLGRICVQSAVVDVEAKVDDARERNVLRGSPHLRVGKKERHCHERSNNHCVFPP